jgi:dTMP kinase
MYSGFFINFEGIDGTGKTTQIIMLAEALKEQGHALYITKEPGDAKCGSNVGAGVRAILFGTPGTKNVGPGVADLLFLSDHLQNTYDIRAAVKSGKIVLSDRYADSQFAYAASPSKRAPAWANKLFEEHYGPTPDMTVLFVVRGPLVGVDTKRGGRRLVEDISWALTRANARHGIEAGKQDGKAWNSVEEQRTIQEAYLGTIGTKERTFSIQLWESMTPEDVHQLVLTETLNRLAGRGSNPQMVLPVVEPITAQVQ